jgi:ATP-binding cassette subfamily A (ABC1) protein 3
VINHPFPLLAGAEKGIQAAKGTFIAFLFSIAFALIPANVVSFIVNERESCVKHQ